MSCTEVMYQPYSPYFPYHQRAAAAAAASCPAGASGIAAAQAACLDYKRFVSPKMQDLLAGGAGMAGSPATPPGSLQSLGPQRNSSAASSHHSRNHHHHHSNTASSSSNNNNGNGPHGSSGRSSSSSSSCAVASSPSTPLARSPDRDDSGQQANKGRASGTPGSSSSVPGGHASSVTSTGAASPSAAASSSSAAARDTQFLSANCVVFTYYTGDISAVVDEHFSRALSEPSAYDGTSSCKAGGAQLKDAPPMSQRNFPASFWNCHQSSTGGSPSHGMGAGGSVGAAMSGPVDLYTGGEAHHPYHSHHAHHHASAANAAALHASLQSDPWHYALTAPQAGPYRSSAMHELAYSAGGAAHRFGAAAAAQQYGSLLLQPRSSRLGSVSATCTALDKSDAWAAASPAARYHHDQLAAAAGHHVVDASSYQAAAHHYGPMGAAAAAAAMTDANSGGYMLELYKFQAMHAYR